MNRLQRWVFLGWLLLSASAAILAADEQGLFARTLLKDLETTERQELLEWAASLGLSTRGTRRDIEDRILDFYQLDRRILEREQPIPQEGDRQSVITINRARGTQFFDVEQIDERMVRFSGGVILTVQDGDAVHTVSAERITINVERNTLVAQGGVEYSLRRGSGEELFRGEMISFDIESWDGTFLRGITESPQDIDGEVLEFRIEGRRITRAPGEIVVVEGATVTSSPADPPNWSIQAGRIWILAPGEWALANATLHVGRVPVLYFPFFFIPGDKVFFHPAAGTRPREGSFIQTTTYIFGQRDDGDPPLSILRLADGPDESEREIRGLFLRIPEEPREPDPPGWNLKIMVDLYTILGYYAGIDASLPGLLSIDAVSGRLGFGFSRNIYRDGTGFTSFFVEPGATGENNGEPSGGTAQQYWNRGFLLGNELPFRYESELSIRHRWPTVSLAMDMLMLSDPSFRRDFGNRTENMDWGFLLNADGASGDSGSSSVSGYAWSANVTWNPSVTSLRPWVQSASLSTVRTQLIWRDRSVATDAQPPAVRRSDSSNSPEERFLFPQSLVAPELAGRVSGTIFSWRQPSAAPAERRRSPDDSTARPSQDDGPPYRSPWEEEGGDHEQEDHESDEIALLPLPPILRTFPGIAAGSQRAGATVTYSWQPSLRYDRFTNNREWETAEDIRLDWRYSTLQTANRGQITVSGNAPQNLVTLRSTLNLDHRFQTLDYSAQEPDEAERRRLEQDTFRLRSFSATQNSQLTATPVPGLPALRESTIRYTLNSRIYRRAFREIDESGNPSWDSQWASWTRDDISRHQAQARLVWPLWGSNQSMTATSDLPPLDPAYLGNLRLQTGPVVSTFSTGIRQRDDEWQRDPLVQGHQLSLLQGNARLDQRLTWNLEDVELDQSRTTVNLWNTTATITGQRTTGFTLDPVTGWSTDPDVTFRWTRLALGATGNQTLTRWYRRVELSMRGRAALDFDLRRFTSGSLVLDYGFRLRVHQFLDMELSARSRNDRMYQYFPGLAEQAGVQSRSLTQDLARSFNLFRQEDREESNFNVETVSFSLIHYLQDWELSVRYTGAPELRRDSGEPRYQWNSVTVLMVRWRPITELERVLRIDNGAFEFGE